MAEEMTVTKEDGNLHIANELYNIIINGWDSHQNSSVAFSDGIIRNQSEIDLMVTSINGVATNPVSENKPVVG